MQSALQMEVPVLHNGVQVGIVTSVGLGQRVGLLCCSQMGEIEVGFGRGRANACGIC